MTEADTEADPAIPAATLILFRDCSGAPPELLMVERASKLAFAGGAMVFPGGRVDPGDHAMAACLGDRDRDEAAARIAAIRETLEEVGLGIAIDPVPDVATLAAMRAALHEGTSFTPLLASRGLAVVPDRLVAFARWRPDHAPARIFDARFYLARLPHDAPAPRVDATETVGLVWTTAADMLAAADAGERSIIYPTRRNLERLATYADYDAAVADALRHPVRTITPFVTDRDGVRHLCIPDGLGYPVTSEAMADAVRG